MKIRAGFVSNSSSTSYTIVGHQYSYDEINELAQKVGYEYWRPFLQEETSLFFVGGEYYITIGREISNMKDDETLGQVKNDVKEKLKKLGLHADVVNVIPLTIED